MNRREIDEFLEKARRSLAPAERLLAAEDSEPRHIARLLRNVLCRPGIATDPRHPPLQTFRCHRLQRAFCKGRDCPAPSVSFIERCVRRPRRGRLWSRRGFPGTGAFRNRRSPRFCRSLKSASSAIPLIKLCDHGTDIEIRAFPAFAAQKVWERRRVHDVLGFYL